MRVRHRIKTRFFLALSLILTLLSFWGYMVLRHKEPVCTGVNITSKWGENIYVSKALLEELEQNKAIKINNEKLKNIDLVAIKTSLEKKPWIQAVKLFFTPRHILEIMVDYRVPVAKVYFRVQGYYKYLDKDGMLLPRINGTFAELPLIVSSLAETTSLFQEQSLKNMVELLRLCETNSVWKSLFAFVEIQNARGIFVHLRKNGLVVLFGDLDNLRNKICKFATFYSYFWTNKHRVAQVIDLRFKHQVLTR